MFKFLKSPKDIFVWWETKRSVYILTMQWNIIHYRPEGRGRWSSIYVSKVLKVKMTSCSVLWESSNLWLVWSLLLLSCKKVVSMCLAKIIGIFKIIPVSGKADLKILWQSCHYFNPSTVFLCKLHFSCLNMDPQLISTRTGIWGTKAWFSLIKDGFLLQLRWSCHFTMTFCN